MPSKPPPLASGENLALSRGEIYTQWLTVRLGKQGQQRTRFRSKLSDASG